MYRDKLEAIRTLRKITNKVIVACSTGKDSVASLELCYQLGFKLHVYNMQIVPGLSFIERYLRYLEARYKIEIVRWVHPDYAMRMKSGAYCLPQEGMESLKHNDIVDAARQRFSVDWLVTGEKKIDSLERRAMQSSWGAVQVHRSRCMPLSEWSNRDVYAYMKIRRVQISTDYSMFGCSLASLTDGFVLPRIKERYPDDYAKIIDAFPFAEANLIRPRDKRLERKRQQALHREFRGEWYDAAKRSLRS